MRRVMLCGGALLVLAGVAQAQPADSTTSEGEPRFRERVLAAFDVDGDGKLNERERGEFSRVMQRVRRQRDQAAPEGNPPGEAAGATQPPTDEAAAAADRPARRDRAAGPPDAGPRRPGRGPAGAPAADAPRRRPGPPGAGDRPEGAPPRGLRRGGPGGPPALGGAPGTASGPRIERLFQRFDANGDQQLSREEFEKLMAQLAQLRPAGFGPRPDGPGRPGAAEARGPQRPDRGPRADARPDRGPRDERPARGPRRDRPEAAAQAQPAPEEAAAKAPADDPSPRPEQPAEEDF